MGNVDVLPPVNYFQLQVFLFHYLDMNLKWLILLTGGKLKPLTQPHLNSPSILVALNVDLCILYSICW